MSHRRVSQAIFVNTIAHVCQLAATPERPTFWCTVNPGK